MYRPRRPRATRQRRAFRARIAILAGALAAAAVIPATAATDSTDDYPIPHPMIVTTCTAEQILAAAQDYVPVYYERYFYSLSPADRRAYSEEMVTQFADPMTASLPNWAKIFFNNKGVADKETDHCADYSPDDMSVWDG